VTTQRVALPKAMATASPVGMQMAVPVRAPVRRTVVVTTGIIAIAEGKMSPVPSQAGPTIRGTIIEAEPVRIMIDVVIMMTVVVVMAVVIVMVVVLMIVRPGSRARIPSRLDTYIIPSAIPLIPIVINDSTPKLDQGVPFQI
jgi:hypothetical protein